MEKLIKRNNKKKKIMILIIIIIFTILGIATFLILKTKGKSKAVNNQKNETILGEDEENTAEDMIMDISQLTNETNEEPNTTDNGIKNNIVESKQTDTKMPYYIKINYGAQVVTVYQKDENNEYTVPVRVMLCSTGTFTPKSGTYQLKSRWRWLGLQGDVAGQYCTQITGNILFHSVPYLEKGNPSTLEYWEYDKLGTYASAGCIRMNVSDAIWIYNNCNRGTNVEFYSETNPGPLGKPTGRKISNENEELRNWDPTDPDESNPWNNNKNNLNENEQINEIKQNITNNTNTNEQNKNNNINENNTTSNKNTITNENIINTVNNNTENENANNTSKEETIKNVTTNETESKNSIYSNDIMKENNL